MLVNGVVTAVPNAPPDTVTIVSVKGGAAAIRTAE